MKIAILTLPLSNNNYGGILQNWALQQVLKEMGHEPITLNRVHRIDFLRRLKSIIVRLYRSAAEGNLHLNSKDDLLSFISGFTEYKIDDKALRAFIRERICLTKELRNTWDLFLFSRRNSIDCYIIGSDQVWREIYSPKISDYFCRFLHDNSKRISYAASFGISNCDISSRNITICRKLISKFKDLSVREFSGQAILSSVFDVQSEVVLDPTLLLSKDEYLELVASEDLIDDNTITSYILDSSSEKNIILESLCSSFNYKRISLELFPQDDYRNPGRLVSISEWIASFASAKFILTDSFHGCVFAIIFNVPFIVIANNDRGIDRFISLLRQLNLESRLVFSYEDFLKRKEQMLTPIDYSSVNTILRTLQERSLNYLRRNTTDA